MDTQYGPTLSAAAFEPPFDDIVAKFVEKGRLLHASLEEHMLPKWKQRPFEILIIDNEALDARITNHAGRDRICIFHGAFEHIYGCIHGLLSTPTFFPAIGNIRNEVRPQNLPGGRFPRLPLLRNASDADQRIPLFFPKDQARMMVADVLATLSLEFVIFHEIGHIVGGHLEIPRNGRALSTISEFQYAINEPSDSTFQQVLECDADAFACHATSWIHTQEKMAVVMRDILNASAWQPKDFALLTYLFAVGVLFCVLNPSAPRKIDACKSSHPHPAVRACLVASSAMAFGLDDGSYTPASLSKIAGESIGNIEQVWADLCFSGQNPQSSDVWAKDVHDTAMALFESYGKTRTLLDQFARLRRRWDNWEWPRTQESG